MLLLFTVVVLKITDSYAWSSDKIPELQQACLYDVITRNYTDLNDTASLLQAVMSDARSVTEYTCEPADCNSHGICHNGTCLCTAGTHHNIILSHSL